MFIVAFGQDYPLKKVVLADAQDVRCCLTIERVKKIRLVSGQLVFFGSTRTIVPHDFWLFDWERKDPRCYARQNIAHGVSLSFDLRGGIFALSNNNLWRVRARLDENRNKRLFGL